MSGHPSSPHGSAHRISESASPIGFVEPLAPDSPERPESFSDRLAVSVIGV